MRFAILITWYRPRFGPPACYRPHFGPEARNGKENGQKMDFGPTGKRKSIFLLGPQSIFRPFSFHFGSPARNGVCTTGQDKFDRDKGQKSAISGRRLHRRLSTGFFAFSPVLMCNLVRRAPQNLEKVAKNPVEKVTSNPVTSVAVMVFFSALNQAIRIAKYEWTYHFATNGTQARRPWLVI